MSRKFRGRRCAYCSIAISDTDDHVFARGLFLERDRGNLPKAPACAACNGKKSQLEHYAASILPLGGRHSQARAHFETMIPRRMQKNQALFRKLRSHNNQVWVQEPSGLLAPTMTFPVDGVQLRTLFEYVAKGLIWHHCGVYLSDSDKIAVTFLNVEGDRLFQEEVFGQYPGTPIRANLGNGTVLYEGIRNPNTPQMTAWRISVYGGIWLASGDTADGISSTIGVVTQPTLNLPAAG